MSKRISTILQYCFFLGLGGFLIWWSLKGLTPSDKHYISVSLGRAKFWLVIPGLAVLILSHWVRALRWKLIIEPLDYRPSTINTFFAVMIGYLANQAVPRLGEVLRCSTLTRYEKIPMDKLVGTVILERLVDVVCLGVIFAIALLAQPHLYQTIIDTFFPSQSESGPSHLVLYAVLALLGIGIALVLWMLITKKKAADLVRLIRKIVAHVWQGFAAIKSLKRPFTFIFYSLAIWLLYALSVYIGFLMLEETQQFGFIEALTVLCAGSLGMIATPGGVGAYAFLVQQTMLLYHLNAGVGLALGWLLWIVQVVVVVIFGALSLLALPVFNRNRRTAVPS
ncbi:lysylphosphatidylglycerol synthase transmembrane domain-containing protein [Niabella insulamsoli]|uniref:lysylphosphatidylglycerol synthase transmembrane domain-containing protein n=1 Tax=Niabella insulamsoli TaxID=3144874 RepID=UPI0031FBEFCC